MSLNPNRRQAVEEEKLTTLWRLAARLLGEMGGHKALRDWQREMFDDMANALWRKDLPLASKVASRLVGVAARCAAGCPASASAQDDTRVGPTSRRGPA
jgi:hypothetical protein